MTSATSRSPRIVMVARNGRGQTGSVNKILDHARRFAAHGWSVTVAASRIDPSTLDRAGLRAHRVRESWLPFLRPRRSAFQQRAERWLARQHFDLVIAHGDILVQDVLHVHNCVHLAHEILEGRPPAPDHDGAAFHHALLSGQRFRLLIANGDLMRRDLHTRFGIPLERIQVIHPGYDPERFRPQDRERLGAPIRAQLGIPADRLVLGFITSGNFRKRGLDLLISAIGGLDRAVRDRLHLVVVGSDASSERYRSQAQQAGFGDRLTLVGKQTAIEAWHHAMDLFVLPARIEEFGQAAQEAMVCGVPAIITDRMGVAERLPDHAREGITRAGDIESLRATLTRFVNDPALRRSWVETCREACQHNTWTANWEQHLPLYRRLLPASGGVATPS